MPIFKETENQPHRKLNVKRFIETLRISGAENQVKLLVNAMDPEKFKRLVIVAHEEGVM